MGHILTFSKKYRGFSLVETMISLTISAILAGGFSYWFFIGNQERYFSRTATRIQDAQEDTFQQISKILNDAIRVNGFSLVAYPGISDSATTFTNQENLRIYRVRYPEISAGITQVSLATAGKILFRLEHIPTPAPGDEAAQKARASEVVLSDYLSVATVSPRYLAFYNGGTVNILPVKRSTGTPVTEDSIITGTFEADLSAFPESVRSDLSTIGSQIDGETEVVMAEEVDLRFSARGELQLVEKFPDPTVEKVSLIQTKIEQLLYGFSFGGHQRPEEEESLALIIPDRNLDHWDAHDYHQSGCNPTANPSTCCDPTSETKKCVNIGDLATVRLTVTMSAPYSGKLPRAVMGDRVRVVNSRLYRDGLFSISPSGYGLVLNQTGDMVQDTECLNPYNRCGVVPECANMYTDDNPRSPFWVGYAQYDGNPTGVTSNYCEAGTAIDGDPSSFIPPETPAGKANIPTYRPPYEHSSNRQINAAIKHFGNIYEWAWRHPMMWFWWNSLQMQSASSTYRSGSFPNFEWNVQAFEDLKTNFMNHPRLDDPQNFWKDHITCRLGWDSTSGYFRWIWYARSGGSTYGSLADVTQPASADFSDFGTDHANESGTKLIMITEQKCACEANAPSIVPKYVCNHEATRTSPYCSNTWVTEPDPLNPPNTRGKYVTGTETLAEGLKRKVYAVNAPAGQPGYANGLTSVNQAALCQCLNETYNAPYLPSSPPIPGYEGWSVSNIWDFRVDPADPNFADSISIAGGQSLTAISGTAPIMNASSVGLPDRDLNWFGHYSRAQNSPHVRVVRVHYQTADGQAPLLSEPIRCDTAWRGYIGRCTQPMPAGAEKTNILTQLALANPTLTAEQREAYAGFCSRACFLEQGSGVHAVNWYSDGTKIRALRQALTGAATPEDIPAWCGGSSLQGSGIF